MKREISRREINGLIEITFDDGSKVQLGFEAASPDVKADAEDSSKINKGHTIKEQ